MLKQIVLQTMSMGTLSLHSSKEVENDPKSLSEAQARNNWPHWKEAMDAEIATLDCAGTWSDVHSRHIRTLWIKMGLL